MSVFFLLHKVNCNVTFYGYIHFHVFIDTSELPSLRLVPSPEKTSKKLIEELSSHTAACETNSVMVPEHSIHIKEASSKHPRRVCVKVNLPGVRSVTEVELEVSKVRQSSQYLQCELFSNRLTVWKLPNLHGKCGAWVLWEIHKPKRLGLCVTKQPFGSRTRSVPNCLNFKP